MRLMFSVFSIKKHKQEKNECSSNDGTTFAKRLKWRKGKKNVKKKSLLEGTIIFLFRKNRNWFGYLKGFAI